MKSSRTIYLLYSGIGWAVCALFFVYLAGKGRVSWWVPAVGIPVGVLLQYSRHKYSLPFVDGARRKTGRNSGQGPI